MLFGLEFCSGFPLWVSEAAASSKKWVNFGAKIASRVGSRPVRVVDEGTLPYLIAFPQVANFVSANLLSTFRSSARTKRFSRQNRLDFLTGEARGHRRVGARVARRSGNRKLVIGAGS